MESLLFEGEKLKIPHPSLLSRPFAMLPFADLLPQWKYPEPGPYFEKSATELVSIWKRTPHDEVPFHTRRSTSCLTELVGILNITPDSFSDGGKYENPSAALEQARHLLKQGAQVLDIGAESTRPGAQVLSPQEEWRRLEPVLRDLQTLVKVWPDPVTLSVDTRNAEVAALAIRAGANWINDVTGMANPTMRRVVADSAVDVVIMHSLSVPPQKTLVLPAEEDPITCILSWAEKRIQEIMQSGISRDRIIFDPGFGFGKTIEHSWELLRGMRRFQELGVRILVGHSRKSFLASVTPRTAGERDIETLALTFDLLDKGVDFLRVHECEKNARVLKVWSQLKGVGQCRE